MRTTLTILLTLQLVSVGLVVPNAVPPLPIEVATNGLASGDVCPASAPLRTFDVLAIRIPISYNHWGDYDLEGRMFVLRDEAPELLAQVAGELAEAGLDTGEHVAGEVLAATMALVEDPTPANAQDQADRIAQSIGLTTRPPTRLGGAPKTDPFDVSPLVRPLVVRANLGDCVDMALTNLLAPMNLMSPAHSAEERVSLHVHEVVAPAGQGMELGNNADDTLGFLESGTYRFYIPPGIENEGAHLFHSHADARYQTKHGLFGAVVAEPAGATWLNPDGTESLSNPEAIIVQPGAADFREFVFIYHDEVELIDRKQNPLPIVNTQTGEYGPGSKAINYRTEPFMNRFKFDDALNGPNAFDKSQGYGSYTYGDPATFIPRSYVGDPTKFRLLNAGPGQHHVHHLHGGGDRWRVSPYSDDTQFDDGLVKSNPIIRSKSERIDVQSIGPGESYDAEIEGGSGGTQAGVGDFLIHCHIVEHYVAGMWTFWRVYNTAQDGLAELPDRDGLVPDAVSSVELIGETMPDGTVLDADNLDDWIEPQLPAQGVPGEDDASVWDWTVEAGADGPLYLGEPETTIAWPNYESATPGERPELQFNPDDGRLSFPFLKPHFGKRPPFAPAHGPAPYLGNSVAAGRPDGLCPPAAPVRNYLVDAFPVPVSYNKHGDVDTEGAIFALAQDRADILSGAKDATSLVIRANQGDCVDILLASGLEDNAENHGHSKVNMHIHLVQFDVQASDGVISGMNYEQSVRPATSTGSSLAEAAAPGAATIVVADGAALRPGTHIGIGLLEPSVEVRRVEAVVGNVVSLDAPLDNAHAVGVRVGPEFVRYRWFADVELGIVYWHDHVDGLNGWRHGLFGSLIVEPNGAAWRDPTSGATGQATSHVVDIIAPGRAFREYVVQFQDRSGCIADNVNLCPKVGFPEAPLQEEVLASFNLRSAPFRYRSADTPLLSSASNATSTDPVGDPDTDLWRAYVGDPVMVRYLHTGQSLTTGVGTFGIKGHRFPLEQNSPDSRLRDSISAGISSHHNLWLDCGAGSCAKQGGDYLYGMTQPDLMKRGAWGVFRVHDELQGDLLALPGYETIAGGNLPAGPVRSYDVVALETDVVANGMVQNPIDISTKLFALASEEADILAGVIEPQPLVLRARPGETIEVALTNHLDEPVSLFASLLLGDPEDMPVGENADNTVSPGGSRTYTWYADDEVGTVYLTSFAQPAQHAIDGLYGAIVIEPAGSTFAPATGPAADIKLASGDVAREQVLLYASNDPFFEGSVMLYTVAVAGDELVNYRSEPLDGRADLGYHTCDDFPGANNAGCTEEHPIIPGKFVRKETRNPQNWEVFSSVKFWDPQTPLVTASSGQVLILRAVTGAGDQIQTHSFSGGVWKQDPAMAGSNLIDTATMGPGETSDAWLVAGAPGDYLWGAHRTAFLEGGAWGIVRVG